MDSSHLNDPQICRIQLEKILDQLFLKANTRAATCADLSYPKEESSLRAWLDQQFAPFVDQPRKEVSALFAPHIDFRVNMNIYAHAFSHIRHVRAKRVFMIGTSHYSGMYWPNYEHTPFILTEKDFETPMGLVKTDKAMVNKINSLSNSCTTYDVAHRIEHSLELHAVLLKYLWSHDFLIVPILVGSFDELLYSDNNPTKSHLEEFSAILKTQITNDDLVLISGDLSHIGKKFGDRESASTIVNRAKANDVQFMNLAEQGDKNELIKLMQSNEDEFRICGFPPLLTYLNLFESYQGEIMHHSYWDESEMQSGVSFGSILWS